LKIGVGSEGGGMLKRTMRGDGRGGGSVGCLGVVWSKRRAGLIVA
jgi:hypothetical protein